MDLQNSEIPIITRQQLTVLAIVAIVIGGAYAYSSYAPKPAGSIKEVSVKKRSQTVRQRQDLIVHVAGAVVNPGVYKVRDGGRVIDAIESAGGERGDADLDQLNLAAPLVDGLRILVPAKGTAANAVEAAEEVDSVHLNTAGPEELQELPGVGEVIAERIIETRKKLGRFKAIEDLQEIEGIGPKKFSRLKDSLVLD